MISIVGHSHLFAAHRHAHRHVQSGTRYWHEQLGGLCRMPVSTEQLMLQTNYQLCTFLTHFREIELASECLNLLGSVLEVFDCEEVLGVGR